MTDRWLGAGSRGPLRPSREPGRRLVDVELSKEDVRKERRSAKAMPTCEKRRSTVAELVAAGQPQLAPFVGLAGQMIANKALLNF